MVLERSFDSADLKRLLLDSQAVMDRSLLTSSRRDDPTRISRPPLPKGSQVFEKVLDEFQPERQGPQIRVSDATGPAKPHPHPHPHPHHHPHHHHHHHHHHHVDTHHLSPYFGRSRSNSKSEGVPRSRASSPVRSKSPSRPGSESRRGGDDSVAVPHGVRVGQPSTGS